MDSQNDEIKVLPHHKQLPLCTTRLPYRQGRKLTAVKVYTIVNESNHLLIFGVPALNLWQETKAQFMKFGKLLQFNISKQHHSEIFTETYHAQYEKIQSARIAKRMLDAKNFYGGSLHVCYAPEMENIAETRQKIIQRQKDVFLRLQNLQTNETKQKDTIIVENVIEPKKLNMGEENTIINTNGEMKVNGSKRKKDNNFDSQKKFKPCFINNYENDSNANEFITNELSIHNNKPYDISKFTNVKDTDSTKQINNNIIIEKEPKYNEHSKRNNVDIEIIDCTSVEKETITNIYETLNYNKFGGEIVKQVAKKPVNRIIFNVNKKII